ncbi:MAG: hypothetical protein QM715_07235 [Nibricoccus sp.]
MDKDSTASYLLRLICLVWAIGIGLLSVLLLFVAVTHPGRIFAITALAMAILPFVAHTAWLKGSKRWAIAAGLMLLEVVCDLSYAVAHAPKGTTTERSSLLNLYAGGADRFSRYDVGNLLPEVDQLLLTLVPNS